MYEDMRYFGAAEACWRLFSFSLFERQPPVHRLPVHLDGDVQHTSHEGEAPPHGTGGGEEGERGPARAQQYPR